MAAPWSSGSPLDRQRADLMRPASAPDVTDLLEAWGDGDRCAMEALVEAVYDELHRIASIQLNGERAGHTLETTGLVHEAYLRLVDQRRARWHSRLHFFAVASKVMRRVLIDYARERRSQKRGGDLQRVSLSSGIEAWIDRPAELLEVDVAVEKLSEVDPELSQVVELRFFGGFNNHEIADLMGMSTPTVIRRWRAARAWLYQHLNGGT